LQPPAIQEHERFVVAHDTIPSSPRRLKVPRGVPFPSAALVSLSRRFPPPFASYPDPVPDPDPDPAAPPRAVLRLLGARRRARVRGRTGQRAILEKAHDRPSQGGTIAGRHQEARLPVQNLLGYPADPRSDHGPPRAHRLEDEEGEAQKDAEHFLGGQPGNGAHHGRLGRKAQNLAQRDHFRGRRDGRAGKP